MSLPDRIALIGKSGVGKSTLSQQLVDLEGFQLCSTGQICRGICQALFGEESKASAMKVTDALREIDSSIFLKAAMRGLAVDRPTVIDAIRFRSDVEIARQHAFALVRVHVNRDIQLQRLNERGQVMNEPDHLHSSETELDEVEADYDLINEAGKGELLGHLKRITGRRG